MKVQLIQLLLEYQNAKLKKMATQSRSFRHLASFGLRFVRPLLTSCTTITSDGHQKDIIRFDALNKFT